MYLGADPEFAIIEKATGKAVPASLFFPPKDAKLVVPLGGAGYYRPRDLHSHLADEAKLFRDGFMLEVNIPPAGCRAYSQSFMRQALRAAYAKIGDKFTLSAAQAVPIDLADMKDVPDDLRTFGCEPSFCAYTGKTKIAQIDAMQHPWRYAGGHMHFGAGYPKVYPHINDVDEHPAIIRLLDYYLGIPLTCLFGSEESTQRRKYYGQAGEFRSQKYPDGSIGVEYRTPGPEVWTDDNIIAGFAFGVAKRLLNNFKRYKAYQATLDSARFDDVREAINLKPEKAWKLVAAVPGFYNVDTLKIMRVKVSGEITLHQTKGLTDYGFTEKVTADWGVKLPGLGHLGFRVGVAPAAYEYWRVGSEGFLDARYAPNLNPDLTEFTNKEL